MVVSIELVTVGIECLWSFLDAFSLTQNEADKTTRAIAILLIKRLTILISLDTFSVLSKIKSIRALNAGLVIELVAIRIKLIIRLDSWQAGTFKEAEASVTAETIAIDFIVSSTVRIDGLADVILVAVESGCT